MGNAEPFAKNRGPARSSIAAFFSYARYDDVAAHGLLSKIRARLEVEVRALSGNEHLAVFQDTDDIPPGHRWPDEIRTALSASAVFIPVITPFYFTRAACRDELQFWLDRYKSGVARKRIVPIRFRPLDALTGDGSLADPIRQEIEPLQAFDFERFRRAQRLVPKIQAEIERLAGIVIQAMSDAPDPAPMPRPNPLSSQDGRAPPPDYGRNVHIGGFLDAGEYVARIALVFTVAICGLRPRSPLEHADPVRVSLDDVLRIIAECQFSIHQQPAHPTSAIALGLTLGAGRFGDPYQRLKAHLVLARERQPDALGDVAALELRSYARLPDLIRTVRTWLARVAVPGAPAAPKIARRWRDFWGDLPSISARIGLNYGDLTFAEIASIVDEWLRLDLDHDIRPRP